MVCMYDLLDTYLVIQVIIDENAAAVFAYYDLLMLAYLRLALRRYNVKATTARIADDRHYSKAVAIAVAAALISCQQPRVYLFLSLVRFL